MWMQGAGIAGALRPSAGRGSVSRVGKHAGLPQAGGREDLWACGRERAIYVDGAIYIRAGAEVAEIAGVRGLVVSGDFRCEILSVPKDAK